MKYLKKFETETDRSGYTITDEMVSYVTETDEVHVKPMYKMLSYIWHLNEPSDNIRLFSEDSDTYQQTYVDKITINGTPIDLRSLYKSSVGSAKQFFTYQKYDVTYKGQPIYSMPTKGEIVSEDDFTYVLEDTLEDYVDVYFDFENGFAYGTGIVRCLSDDTQVSFTATKSGETVTLPLFVNTSWNGRNDFIPYVVPDCGEKEDFCFSLNIVTTWYNQVTEEWVTEGCFSLKSNIIPFENGDYEIVLYSLDKNIILDDYCCYMDNERYKHITLSKNITSIRFGTFGSSYNLNEIWFEGTIAEFNEIQKSTRWNASYYRQSTGETQYAFHTVHCSDGDITV